MSDRVTRGAEGAARVSDRVIERSLLVRIGATCTAFVVAATLGGVLWERLWTSSPGLTYNGAWFMESAGPDLAFQGAALYVLVALPLGLLLGVLCSMWPRHEVATVLTVLVAAGIGALVMYAVGHGLGPGDPQALAVGKPDYTAITSDLVLNGPDKGANPLASTALLAMPVGAMLGLVGRYLLARRAVGARHHG